MRNVFQRYREIGIDMGLLEFAGDDQGRVSLVIRKAP